MTWDEARTWVAYRNKRGIMNLGLRMEIGFAMLASFVAATRGVRVDMNRLTPHLSYNDETATDDEKLKEVMSILGGAYVGKQKPRNPNT